MATSYRYCLSCRALWSADAPNACPACDKPGLRDLVPAAYCDPCGVAWHPGVTLDCWVCDGPGSHAPQEWGWERLPSTAQIIHAGAFGARSPV